MPKVTMIPATINPLTRMPTAAVVKRRVAAYARVSTDSEEQLTSYEAQIDYYTNYIARKTNWEFVKVYTDEGISATNTKHREGFNEMIADALAGRIDLIVTKSVSRFARNTVDSLTAIRNLKAHGVEVYFEKENIYTFDGKGELFITIMSSMAQEESRSISENVTWGQRKRFSDGKVSLPYKQFLGYEKGEDGRPRIVPEEAKIIRKIYSLFMSGKTEGAIAQQLTEAGIPTPSGKAKWGKSTIRSILTNEKYRGSAILQKRFTVDFLTKKMKVNEGEVPQYYVEQSHEAIIEPEEWKAVQAELKRRQDLGNQYSGQSVLASKIVCGDCGAFYGRKVWHSNSQYRRFIWRCNQKFYGENKCGTPTLNEDNIKDRFLAVINRMLGNREGIIEDCRVAQAELTDCSALDAAIEELQQEIEIVLEMIKKLIKENCTQVQDQEVYQKKYDALNARFETAGKKCGELKKRKEERCRKAGDIGGFIFTMREMDEPLTIFNDRLWFMLVDRVVAHNDGRLVFCLKNGAELEG